MGNPNVPVDPTVPLPISPAKARCHPTRRLVICLGRAQRGREVPGRWCLGKVPLMVKIVISPGHETRLGGIHHFHRR
jgi:hypothetical protein